MRLIVITNKIKVNLNKSPSYSGGWMLDNWLEHGLRRNKVEYMFSELILINNNMKLKCSNIPKKYNGDSAFIIIGNNYQINSYHYHKRKRPKKKSYLYDLKGFYKRLDKKNLNYLDTFK